LAADFLAAGFLAVARRFAGALPAVFFAAAVFFAGAFAAALAGAFLLAGALVIVLAMNLLPLDLVRIDSNAMSMCNQF